MEDLVGEV